MIFSLLLPIFSFALSGNYVQNCNSGLIRSESFSGAEVIFSEAVHRDHQCSTASFTMRSYGSYSLGKAVEQPSGASEIDFVFTKVTITPDSAELAASYRARMVCGLSNWSESVENEVTGQACDFFLTGSPVRAPGSGDLRYGIFQLVGDSLYFGALTAERNASSPDRRPLQLDPRPFVRQ